MNNSIINAVKRLERAGSENSRTTQKLFGAARQVAELIEDMVPAGEELPRGYYVKKVQSNIGYGLFLCYDELVENNLEITRYIDGIGGYLHGDFHCWIPGQDRDTVLQFAKDVATGFLDEIAEWLEKRAEENQKATEVLENAK
jgi:hypothetical protein